MSVQDMRAELKVLRSEHPDFKPVSKMKKADISSLLEKMKQHTEITPAIAKTKADAKVEKVAPLKAVKEVKEPKKKAEKAEKVEVKEEPKAEKAEKKKESMAERMARIRALKKKD